MGYQQFKNFASSTLASTLAIGGTSLSVATGEGAKFPSSGDFVCVIFGSAYSNPAQDATAEVVMCTARSADALTITRSQEDTTAKEWASGSKIIHAPTAALMNLAYIARGATAPSNPVDGQLWLDTSQGFASASGYVDLTDVTSDFMLQRGQTAFKAYSSITSLPLRIAIVEGGVYEVIISGLYAIHPNPGTINFNPGDASPALYQRWNFIDSTPSISGGTETPNAYRSGVDTNLNIGEGYLHGCKLTCNTRKQGKTIFGSSSCGYNSTIRTMDINAVWKDATTYWGTLGTITFTYAQSGLVVIRRII